MIRHHNALQLTSSMMLASERNIINRFAGLPGAVMLPVPNELPGVYIPGTRSGNRAVLVAHTDTVWDHQPIRLKYDSDLGCLWSGIPKRGIGADDRAGCAALWALRKLGHSLLIVPAEERGCIGSRAIAEDYPDLLTDHALAIQFDRRGTDDLVFYDGEPEPLLTTMLPYFPDYSEAIGSFSDVAELCPAYGIAGVNVSIGFGYEHTKDEFLDVNAWRRTVECTRAFLGGPPLPMMPYVDNSYTCQGNWRGLNYWQGQDDYGDHYGFPDDPDTPPPTNFWCGDCCYSYDTWEIDERDIDDNPCCPCCGQAMYVMEATPSHHRH